MTVSIITKNLRFFSVWSHIYTFFYQNSESKNASTTSIFALVFFTFTLMWFRHSYFNHVIIFFSIGYLTFQIHAWNTRLGSGRRTQDFSVYSIDAIAHRATPTNHVVRIRVKHHINFHDINFFWILSIPDPKKYRGRVRERWATDEHSEFPIRVLIIKLFANILEKIRINYI